MSVKNQRAEIDSLDNELLRLLNRRAEIALRVGESKAASGAHVCDHTREREVIERMFPAEKTEDRVVLEGKFVDLDQQREELRARKQEIETMLLGIENSLKQAIGEAAGAILPSGVVYTYKLQSRKESVIPASSFRVLRRKEAKK